MELVTTILNVAVCRVSLYCHIDRSGPSRFVGGEGVSAGPELGVPTWCQNPKMQL